MTRNAAALFIALALAGCAAPRDASSPRVAPEQAMALVAPGRSTRDQLAAEFGPPIMIPFDSGNAIAVWRWPGRDRSTRSATELVVLLDASGVVTRARLRQPTGRAP